MSQTPFFDLAKEDLDATMDNRVHAPPTGSNSLAQPSMAFPTASTIERARGSETLSPSGPSPISHGLYGTPQPSNNVTLDLNNNNRRTSSTLLSPQLTPRSHSAASADEHTTGTGQQPTFLPREYVHPVTPIYPGTTQHANNVPLNTTLVLQDEQLDRLVATIGTVVGRQQQPERVKYELEDFHGKADEDIMRWIQRH